MSASDQPKYSSDSFVLQTAGNRHVFRTVHLHLSVWWSVGYRHLTICYRPGPLAGYCCVHSALINYEWMRMGEDTWLLVWETVYLYWRQGGPSEERWDICLCQYAAERDSVEAQTSYNPPLMLNQLKSITYPCYQTMQHVLGHHSLLL